MPAKVASPQSGVVVSLWWCGGVNRKNLGHGKGREDGKAERRNETKGKGGKEGDDLCAVCWL